MLWLLLVLPGNYNDDVQNYVNESPVVEIGDNCPHCEVLLRHLQKRRTLFFTKKVNKGPIPRFLFRGKVVEGAELAKIDMILDSIAPVTVQSTPVTVQSTPVTAPMIVQSAPLLVNPLPTVHVKPRINYGGPSWTWPGDLRSHLMRTHGYSAAQLASMSHSELVALHNSDHNHGFQARQGSKVYRSNQGTYNTQRSMGFQTYRATVRRRASSCPGGKCP